MDIFLLSNAKQKYNTTIQHDWNIMGEDDSKDDDKEEEEDCMPQATTSTTTTQKETFIYSQSCFFPPASLH